MENAVCHFVFYTGPRKGEFEVYTTARISIGRANNCDFRVEAFQLEQVAPHHAEVLLEEGGTYYLYDLGTKSGTYVNGERVHERCVLMSEDYIRFGEEGPEVIFRIGQAAPGRQPLPDFFPVTAELEFFTGSDAGRIFPINAALTTNIGRRADLEIPLDPRGDMIVSGNHCNIRYVNGHFVLTDTSRNGTYVNGDLVDQPMEILDADVIMLGDGGPQARFHVDQAGRRYPNHRALSPVQKNQESSSALKSAHAPEVLASAKPFASGTASVAKQPEPPQAEPEDSDVAGVAPENSASEADVTTSDAEVSPNTVTSGESPSGDEPGMEAGVPASDSPSSDLPEASEAVEDTSEVPVTTPALASSPAIETDVPATAETSAVPAGSDSAKAAPLPGSLSVTTRLKLSELPVSKKQLKIAGGALAVLVVLIIIFTLLSESRQDGMDESGSNFAQALENVKEVDNPAAGFSVKAPEGWSQLVRDNYISIESPDKDIAIDYVRDPRAGDAQLHALLSQNGAEVFGRQQQTVDGRTATIMQASRDDLRRAGSLVSTQDVPVMVVMEATSAAMDRLSEEDRNRLLVGNVTASGPMIAAAAAEAQLPAPAPTPSPTPAAQVAEAPAPTPGAGTSAVPDPPVETAASQPTPPAEQSAAPVEAAPAVTTPSGPAVVSEALNITLNAPANWTGASEEEDAMIMLTDGSGLVVRIARDPGDLDADATFEAMEEENWTRKDVQKGANFTAGEFSMDRQNLLLILIPEAAKTTLLIYCTSPNEFSRDQRIAIKDIMVQLLP